MNIYLEQSKIISKNLHFDSYIIIEDINRNSYNKLINYAFEEDVSNIDEVYNLFLNNYECSKKIFKCKIKGGNNSIIDLIRDNADIIPAIEHYCNRHSRIINTKKIDEVIDIIGNELADQSVLSQSEYMAAYKDLEHIIILFNFIKSNYKYDFINYLIPVYRFNVDDNCYNPTLSGKYDLIHTIEHYKFNEDIILSYQKDQLDIYRKYANKIFEYIIAQKNYINGLSPSDKRVLIDYTRLKSFTLYQEFCKDKVNFLNNFYKYFKEENKKNSVDESEKIIITKTMSNAFATYILELKLDSISDSIKDSILNKKYYDNAESIYYTITKEEWIIILNKYIEDLNRIISGAPPVIQPFICYRGVAVDYVTPTGLDSSDMMLTIFHSSRSSSVSFNYKASKGYYDKGKENNTLYKVLIGKGCKLIFVTPLAGSEIIHEIELIIPADHKFIAVKDSVNTNAWKSYEAPNNIDNKNNICIDPNDYVRTKKLILLPNEKISEAIRDLKSSKYQLNI